MKLQFRVFVAAGATVLVGALNSAPAKATDFGGDCCTDLEDRVAELEAMTVRKGNQNVSVTIYGNVNKAVLFWDDGHEKGTYTVDNNYQDTRFGFTGSAKIKGD